MHRAPDCRISRLWVSTYHSGVGSLTESSKRGLPLSAVASTPSTATNLRTYFGETLRNVIAPLLPHARGPESQEIEGCKPEGKGGQETPFSRFPPGSCFASASVHPPHLGTAP